MQKSSNTKQIRCLKIIVFSLCLLPLGRLAYQLLNTQIIGDPVELMTETTGQWTMRFLLITLCITPLRRLFKLSALIKFRRMLGLFTFFYGACHFLVYIMFDHFFEFSQIWFDIIDKKYIFAGMLAFVLMIPLAITSTNKMIKRLGAKNWRRLHQLIYITAISAVIHYLWLVKADLALPLLYSAILLCLLGYRVILFITK